MKYLLFVSIWFLFSCTQSEDKEAKPNSEVNNNRDQNAEVKKEKRNKIVIENSNNEDETENPSEEELFSFTTETNGKVSLSLTRDSVLIYRNTSDGDFIHILEDDLKDDKEIFSYSYYLRGGGAENAGMDNNSVIFQVNKEKVEIFDDYYAEDDMYTVGLRIENFNTKKSMEVRGDFATKKGSLVDFRNNGLIPVKESF